MGKDSNQLRAFRKTYANETHSLLGLKEFEKVLSNLPKEFTDRRRRNILKKGAQPFIEEAVRRAPKRTGDLALSIGTKHFRNNKRDVFAGYIAKQKVRIAKGVTDQLDAYYVKFVEYGTVNKAANPFIRDSWDATYLNVYESVKDITAKRIKAWNRKHKIA